MPLRLDLNNVEELQLQVLMGNRYDIADHLVLYRAMLLR